MEDEKIETLSKVSENLNQQSIELNKKFIEIEQSLNSMKLGVSGWSKKLIGKNDKGDFAYKFGFCRIGKNKEEWKLVCRKINLNQIDSENGRTSYGLLIPITAMSRSIRLEASVLIEEVVNNLIERSSAYLNDIDNALNNLSNTKSKLEITEGTSNENVDG